VDDEAEVRVDHPLLRRAIAALDALRERDLLGRCEQRILADLVQEHRDRVRGGGQAGRLGVELELVVGVVLVLVCANLDPALLERSVERLELVSLEVVLLRQRRDRVGVDEPVAGSIVEQPRDFRGFEDGRADGASFRVVGRDGAAGSPAGGA
jgi:hypothetical protein